MLDKLRSSATVRVPGSSQYEFSSRSDLSSLFRVQRVARDGRLVMVTGTGFHRDRIPSPVEPLPVEPFSSESFLGAQNRIVFLLNKFLAHGLEPGS